MCSTASVARRGTRDVVFRVYFLISTYSHFVQRIAIDSILSPPFCLVIRVILPFRLGHLGNPAETPAFAMFGIWALIARTRPSCTFTRFPFSQPLRNCFVVPAACACRRDLLRSDLRDRTGGTAAGRTFATRTWSLGVGHVGFDRGLLIE